MPEYDAMTELTAKHLEELARKVDSESRVPMIPKTDDTWIGFVYDARKLIQKQNALRETAECTDTK